MYGLRKISKFYGSPLNEMCFDNIASCIAHQERSLSSRLRGLGKAVGLVTDRGKAALNFTVIKKVIW